MAFRHIKDNPRKHALKPNHPHSIMYSLLQITALKCLINFERDLS